MRDAGWNLKGETATPVMQLKLWMYFITTDTSESLHPCSTTRFFFFFPLLSFLFCIGSTKYLLVFTTRYSFTAVACVPVKDWGDRWDFSFEVLPQRQ